MTRIQRIFCEQRLFDSEDTFTHTGNPALKGTSL